jgi:alginate O-acetyltransferase complex protein AlgJ
MAANLHSASPFPQTPTSPHSGTARPYLENVPGYDRRRSPVSQRIVENPTLANLELALYDASQVLTSPDSVTPKWHRNQPAAAGLAFSGRLRPATSTASDAPHRIAAWPPFRQLLWKALPHSTVPATLAAIEAYKWDDSTVFQAYQWPARVLPTDSSLWVELEFAPWNPVALPQDLDGDGLREIWSELPLPATERDAWHHFVATLDTGYFARTLTRTEAYAWAQELASYWYPSHNTDLTPRMARWPNALALREVDSLRRGPALEDPLVVFRHNPRGQPLYTVLKVPSYAPLAAVTADSTTRANLGSSPKQLDTASRREFMAANEERWQQEAQARSPQQPKNSAGSSTAPLRPEQLYGARVRDLLARTPATQMALEADSSWLFYRKSLEFGIAEGIARQDSAHNPLPHLLRLQQFLQSRQVELLVVPVPPKSEVYPERLLGNTASLPNALVNPEGRAFLRTLQQAGIEVVDLLPPLLEAKATDIEATEPLYQVHDTHWGWRGIVVAAEQLLTRIHAYAWYPEIAGSTEAYSIAPTPMTRLGDLVERLPVERQGAYPPDSLMGNRILKDGEPVQPQAGSPIVLIGDSFTGVYELTDCKSAGIGAHLAFGTGIPVEIITSWGGGPNVRGRFLRARGNRLDNVRLVIYLMAERDFWKYPAGWESLEYPATAP